MDEDTEIALLHSMQAGQEQWDDGAEGMADEGQPVENEDSEEQEQPKETIADEDNGVNSSVRSPSANGAISAMSGVQNPAIAAINSNPESRASSRASNTKPRTVGGFIADDSDDEEDVSTPIPISINPGPTASAPESVSQNPLQTSNGPETGAVGTKDHTNTNVASTISSVGAISENVTQSSESAQVPPANTSALSSSTQKARLPHDVAGKLEDRIKEDPRGDIDAWLSLVGEHRKRNKLDDARAVYERFFKVFPSAVSKQCKPMRKMLIIFTG